MPKPKKESGRSGNGMGTVRQKPNGRWEYRFSVREDDGTSSQKSVSGATQKEAVDRGRKLEEQYRKGLVAKKDGRTFADFAAEWLRRKERSGKSVASIQKYQTQINYITPTLGALKLQKVKPTDVRRVLDLCVERGLQRATQAKVLERIRAIFADAERLELVHRNPAAALKIDTPPAEPRGRALEPHQVAALMEACDRYPNPTMGLFMRLLLGCGLRKGEALGLQWQDLNFDKAELSVVRQYTGVGKTANIGPLKTRKSKRIVPISLSLLERLKSHYDSLLEDFAPAQLKAAFLFGDMATGKPWQVNTPNHALTRMLKRMEEARLERQAKTGVEEDPFPAIRIHDLRHTFGSVALARRFPIGVVSEVMGHANITTTQNIYRHVLKEERQAFSFDIEALVKPIPTSRAQA